MMITCTRAANRGSSIQKVSTKYVRLLTLSWYPRQVPVSIVRNGWGDHSLGGTESPDVLVHKMDIAPERNKTKSDGCRIPLYSSHIS